MLLANRDKIPFLRTLTTSMTCKIDSNGLGALRGIAPVVTDTEWGKIIRLCSLISEWKIQRETREQLATDPMGFDLACQPTVSQSIKRFRHKQLNYHHRLSGLSEFCGFI